jgi:parallel beta-helix repeat protein
MKSPHRVPLLLIACWPLLAPPENLLAQGSLTPPGPPGPTMKTLAQIEPRTPIGALPFTIQSSGGYYLTTNLTGTAGIHGIIIDADDVTLDLNGFALSSVTNALSGIRVANPHVNLVIRNGTIGHWTVGVDASAASQSRFESLRVSQNNGNGLSGGAGSAVDGCRCASNQGVGISVGANSQLNRCGASGNLQEGIVTGSESHVLACTSASNQASGIKAANNCILSECVALGNTGSGIVAGTDAQILNSRASNNGLLGISVGADATLNGCVVSGNLDNGIGAAESAQVIGCKSITNAKGIVVLTGSVVQGCAALQNGGDGIQVTSACTVSGNTATGNFLARDAAGIHVSGANNCIKDNSLLSNDWGLVVDVAGNFIARNSASNNSLNYRILDPNQAMGPIVLTADTKATTNPTANFSY